MRQYQQIVIHSVPVVFEVERKLKEKSFCDRRLKASIGLEGGYMYKERALGRGDGRCGQ